MMGHFDDSGDLLIVPLHCQLEIAQLPNKFFIRREWHIVPRCTELENSEVREGGSM